MLFYLDDKAVKKEAWQMEITEADLEYVLVKETEDNKCRINLYRYIYIR